MNIVRFLFSFKFLINVIAALLIFVAIIFFISKIWLPIRTQQNEIVTVPKLIKQNLFAVLKELNDKNLTYKIDTFRYDDKLPPHQIIYTYPKSGAEVKKGRTIFIKANAKTWRPVFLPNLINNSKRLAFTKITAADLFVGDTIYEPDLAKDVVRRILYNGREIKFGEQIPRFSKIDVVLGKGLKTNVPVPNVEGLTLEQAKYVLKQNFFEVGKINFLSKNKIDSTKLIVYYQDPAPDDFLDEGMAINFWVSETPRDSLQNQIKKLHKTYRKYLFDSTGRVMTLDEVKQASQEVIKETKKAQDQSNNPLQPKVAPVATEPEEGITIE